MAIPDNVMVLIVVMAVAGIGGVVMLPALARQLISGHIAAAARTAVVTGILTVVAAAAAILLGLHTVQLF